MRRQHKSFRENQSFRGLMDGYSAYPVSQLLDEVERLIEKYQKLATAALGSKDKLEAADKILNPSLTGLNPMWRSNDIKAVRDLKFDQLRAVFNINDDPDDGQCTIDYIVKYSKLKFIKSAINEIMHDYVIPYDEGDTETAVLIFRPYNYEDWSLIDLVFLEDTIIFEISCPDVGFEYKEINTDIAWPEWGHITFSDYEPFKKNPGCNPYITLAEYAKMHNVDASTVRKKIQAGNLRAEKPGHDWLIKRDEPWIDLRRKK